MVIWYIFFVLVYCARKNLATLTPVALEFQLLVQKFFMTNAIRIKIVVVVVVVRLAIQISRGKLPTYGCNHICN
jgi:hypothetical protein